MQSRAMMAKEAKKEQKNCRTRFSKETNKKGVIQIIIFPPASAQLIITIVCALCVRVYVYYSCSYVILHITFYTRTGPIVFCCWDLGMHEIVVVVAHWVLDVVHAYCVYVWYCGMLCDSEQPR